MKRGFTKQSSAILDLEDCSEYIRQNNPHAALRFLEKSEITFKHLAEMPGMGTTYHLKNMRFFPISGFEKYLVFYRPVNDGIEIIRVLHSARDLPEILEPIN